MTDITLLYYGRYLQQNWPHWNDLERGEAVVRILKRGVSRRQLAKASGISEGTIRNLAIVGGMTFWWKEQLASGQYSTRQILKAWRAQHQHRRQRTPKATR